MIALILVLVHGAVILSIWEEWHNRGITDTSFHVLGLLLLACVLGIWVMEADTWRFDVVSISTILVSAAAGCAYAWMLYIKTSDLVTSFLRRRDPLRQWLSARHRVRYLLKKQ